MRHSYSSSSCSLSLSSTATEKTDGYGADQPVAAPPQLRDAVAIEHPAHHPLDALG